MFLSSQRLVQTASLCLTTSFGHWPNWRSGGVAGCPNWFWHFFVEKVAQIACRRGGKPPAQIDFGTFNAIETTVPRLPTGNIICRIEVYCTLYFVLIIALYWSVRLVYQLAIKPFRGWDPECRDTSLPEHLLLPAEEGMMICLSLYFDLSKLVYGFLWVVTWIC